MNDKLEEFITHVARPYLEDIFDNFLDNPPIIDFQKAFEQINEFRNSKKTEDFEISYISFTLLRSNLLYGNPIYEIHVYDDDWYLNHFLEIGEIDVSSIFGWIEETKKYLWAEAKKYVGKINIAEVENYISKSLNDFELFFISAFQNYNIDNNHDFTIYTGELYDTMHILYLHPSRRLSL